MNGNDQSSGATTKATGNARSLSSRILTTVGGIGMVVGGIDPLEGSILIFAGSGLMALGAFLGQSERRFITYRLWVFILIAIGLGAVVGLSMVGGFGGSSGRSMWWGVLVLPYLIGWSMGIWGPGSARWLLWLGIGVGLWYVAIFVMSLTQGRLQHAGAMIVFATLGVLTIGGCVNRLLHPVAAHK